MVQHQVEIQMTCMKRRMKATGLNIDAHHMVLAVDVCVVGLLIMVFQTTTENDECSSHFEQGTVVVL